MWSIPPKLLCAIPEPLRSSKRSLEITSKMIKNKNKNVKKTSDYSIKTA